MRSTKKIDEILPTQPVQLIKLNADELGKLIKAKALQAAAMHFAAYGMSAQVDSQLSHSHNDNDLGPGEMEDPS